MSNDCNLLICKSQGQRTHRADMDNHNTDGDNSIRSFPPNAFQFNRKSTSSIALASISLGIPVALISITILGLNRLDQSFWNWDRFSELPVIIPRIRILMDLLSVYLQRQNTSQMMWSLNKNKITTPNHGCATIAILGEEYIGGSLTTWSDLKLGIRCTPRCFTLKGNPQAQSA